MAEITEEAEESPTLRSLYREFLDEREEILKHKWLQSEEHGADIGFDAALVDWVSHHRRVWKKEYLAKKRG